MSTKPEISLKRCKIGARLLWRPNRKSHTRFVCTKINDLGWPWTAETHCSRKKIVLRSAPEKCDPNCQRQNV